MSLGALSREAHETLAIGLNRIGGKSNSGEVRRPYIHRRSICVCVLYYINAERCVGYICLLSGSNYSGAYEMSIAYCTAMYDTAMY